MGRIGKLKRQAIQEANERNLGLIKEQSFIQNLEKFSDNYHKERLNQDPKRSITAALSIFNRDILQMVEKIGDDIYPAKAGEGKSVTFYKTSAEKDIAFRAQIKEVDFDYDTGNVHLRTLGGKFNPIYTNPLTGTKVDVPDTRRTLIYDCGDNSFFVEQQGGEGTVYQKALSDFIEKEYCVTDFALIIQQAGEGDEQSV